MIQSENINELLASLVELQSELPTMPKNKTAYNYKYTDLDTIVQTVKPLLKKYNLAYMQSVGGLTADAITLTTRLFNNKGEYIEDTVVLPIIASQKNNSAQTLGMAITYMRRYTLCAMLGITSDEDVDACNSEPKQEQKQEPKQFAKKQEAKKEKVLKGGDGTEEQKARIKELCCAKYADGTPVFKQEEIRLYSSYRETKYTAQELIDFIENALRNRRADAPELGAKKQDEEIIY
jgi:hypothetical protein